MMHLFQIFSRRRKEDRLHAELNFHVSRQMQDYLAKGLSPEEAERKARIAFGGLDQIKEACRDVRPLGWADSVGRDLRFAWRMLLKHKGFAFTAILTLMLCIGANAAVFSMLYALVFKPLPYPASGRIVEVLAASSQDTAKMPASLVQYLDFKSHTDAFAALAYCEYEEFTLGGEGRAGRSVGMKATAELFDVLGLNPVRGRFFGGENNRAGNDRTVVMTRSYCRSHFTDEKSALGKSVRINGEPYEIIGIAPYELEAMDARLRFVIPMALTAESANPLNRYFVKPESHVYGLLKGKETVESAASKVDTVESHFRAGLPPNIRKMLDGSKMEISGLQSRQSSDVKARLFLLQGGALFVLLIGCVNIAGLFLARLNSRQREIAVRMALGAGRRMILRLQLIESLLLTFTGALLGLAVAFGFIRVINHFALALLPGKQPFVMDSAVLGFAFLIAALSALFISLFPALNMLGERFAGFLQEQSRHSLGGLKFRRMTGALIISQIAVTLILLVGAGLLIRSFANALAVNPGLNPGRLISARIALKPGYGRERNESLQRQILGELKGVPGFDSVALTHSAPYSNAFPFHMGFSVQDHSVRPGEPLPEAVVLGVGPEYLKTMQIPLIEGRWFKDEDINSSHLVLVVNQDLARRYFGNRSAVGKHLSYGVSKGPNDRPEIIGVVGNTRDLRWEKEWGPSVSCIYAPMPALPIPSMDVLCLFVRSSRSAVEAAALLRAAVNRIDPDLLVFDLSSMDDRIRGSLDDRRAIMLLLAGYAGIALLLSAVGIYGTLAYEISQRMREIGIRGAVGCTTRQIAGLILRQGLAKAGAGLLLGMIGAPWLCRFLSSQLFEVKASDPIAYIGVVLLLLIVVIAASYLPARRAASINPVIALRNE